MHKDGMKNIIMSDRRILSWCLYDVGNSAFATTILAAVFPVYFKEVAAITLTPEIATAYWGYASSFSLMLSAFLAPLLGTMADVRGSKKELLLFFTLIGIISTSVMSLLGPGNWKWALSLLILSSAAFSAAIIFYDSLLPHIVSLKEIDRVSAQGFAFGYLGGGLLLALNLLMIKNIPGTLGVRLSFFTVSVWWGIFTVPLILNVPEPPVFREKIIRGKNIAKASFIRLKETFTEIRKYRELFKFLFAFWLYNDGIGTIIRMAAIYGAQLGFSMINLVGALLLTQFTGVPFSLIFGRIAERIGAKRAIFIALSWYFCICIGAVFLSSSWHFWILALSVGMVQGGAQAISRSLYASMVPKIQSAEFFGFYDISSKFAGIIGPALFGVITQITGSSRIGIAALSLTFILGMLILTKVDVAQGQKIAAEKSVTLGQ